MSAVIADPRSSTSNFTEIDLDDPDGIWAMVRAAMFASESVRGIKAVAVSKILHRKRPHLVPIFDSMVFRFYFGKAVGKNSPRKFWPRIHEDVAANRSFLEEVRGDTRTADDREVSLLRVADIAIWEHQVTHCGA